MTHDMTWSVYQHIFLYFNSSLSTYTPGGSARKESKNKHHIIKNQNVIKLEKYIFITVVSRIIFIA
jgi:hypothetical protein